MSAAPRTRERWRGIDDTVCFVAEAFFFGVFSMRWCLLARRRRPFRGNRSRRRLRRERGRPAAATRVRTRARVDPTTRLRASFTYRVVLLILVGSTRHRVRAREDASTRLPEPRSRPGVDFVDPPRRRHSRERRRRGGYSSRTIPGRSGRSPITIDPSSASVPLLRLGSLVVPRASGGESVINRFAARPLGSPSRRRRRVFDFDFVLVLVSRRRGSRARPRRAFVRTSLPPHRDGGERARRSIGAPPRRVRRLVSRYLILSICLLNLKKKKKGDPPRMRTYTRSVENRARRGGDVGFRNNRVEPVAALDRAPTRRVDRDRGAGMQKYPAPDDVTRAAARPAPSLKIQSRAERETKTSSPSEYPHRAGGDPPSAYVHLPPLACSSASSPRYCNNRTREASLRTALRFFLAAVHRGVNHRGNLLDLRAELLLDAEEVEAIVVGDEVDGDAEMAEAARNGRRGEGTSRSSWGSQS